MSGRTTIYDIAKKLNITAATVSRALNNNPKISDSTKELVIATAQELNYRPNRLALALKSGKSNNVGILVPRINRSFFSTIIRGIEEELYKHSYHVIICQSHDDEKREIENIHTLLNAQVDGIFMSVSIESSKKDAAIKRIIQKGVPLIFFDRKKDVDGVSSVTVNDYEGGYKATQHLIDQGCKRIAHLIGDTSIQIYTERFRGYQQALSDNNLKLNEDYIIKTKSTVEDGQEAARKLLALPITPDAIFSSGDLPALGAIQELKKNGLEIPKDVCVVGFSNEPFTKFMELSISTVDQSPLEMGRRAASVFIDQVDKKDMEVKNIVLDAELLIRKSSLKKSNTSDTNASLDLENYVE